MSVLVALIVRQAHRTNRTYPPAALLRQNLHRGTSPLRSVEADPVRDIGRTEIDDRHGELFQPSDLRQVHRGNN